jgi:hypothetical protein
MSARRSQVQVRFDSLFHFDFEPGQVNGTEAAARGVYSGATPSSASRIQSSPGLNGNGIVLSRFAPYSAFFASMIVCIYIVMW